MADDPEDERDDAPADPFESLDSGTDGDREGDPFENLGSGPGAERAPSRAPSDESDAPHGSDPAAGDHGMRRGGASERSGDRGSGATDDVGDRGDAGERRDPLARVGGDDVRGDDDSFPSDAAFETGERGGESPFESGSSAFEHVDVTEIDPDEIWGRLVDTGVESVTPEPGDEVEVSKHTYCEGCEYFSAPPEIHCTHEGTEILEFTDMETVRVVNCPVVAERRELGHED